jgi:hypothetical protein
MKTIIAALIFTGSGAMAMTIVPDGRYQGEGRWTDINGNSGQYEVSVQVSGQALANEYEFGGQSRQFNFEARPIAAGSFDVVVANTKVGEGYCMSAQCHYTATFDGKDFEETMTYYQDHVYRLGSKLENGVKVTWEEAMEKQGEVI